MDPNDSQVEMGCEEEGEEGTRDHQFHFVASLSLKIVEGKDFRIRMIILLCLLTIIKLI